MMTLPGFSDNTLFLTGILYFHSGFPCFQREKTDITQLAQLASNFTLLSPQANEYTLAFVQLPSDVSGHFAPLSV